jgi:hypothetical protein
MSEGYNPNPGFLSVDTTCELQAKSIDGLDEGSVAFVREDVFVPWIDASPDSGPYHYYRLAFFTFPEFPFFKVGPIPRSFSPKAAGAKTAGAKTAPAAPFVRYSDYQRAMEKAAFDVYSAAVDAFEKVNPEAATKIRAKMTASAALAATKPSAKTPKNPLTAKRAAAQAPVTPPLGATGPKQLLTNPKQSLIDPPADPSLWTYAPWPDGSSILATCASGPALQQDGETLCGNGVGEASLQRYAGTSRWLLISVQDAILFD